MPILETATRNELADAFDTAVNTGSGTATAVIETVGDVALATINLQNPAFGAASSGVITLAGVPLSDTSADSTGTAAQMSIYDRDGAKVCESTEGSELTMSSTSITSGETVNLTSLTVTVPVGTG